MINQTQVNYLTFVFPYGVFALYSEITKDFYE